MQRIFIFLYPVFLCIFTMNPLAATVLKETDKQDTKNDLRILELLPNLLCPLAVDPGIPADFIALSPSETLNLFDWVYWGPKDVLKAYFENPASLKEPILRVTLSANVAQAELYKLKKEDPEGFASIKTQWGDYPVLAISTKMEDQQIFMAWVNLNDSEGDWALLFNLVYPDTNGHPNEKDRALWENLLTKTTQLTDGDYFKIYGQDLQEGFTLVNVGGAKLKMLAEKRQCDGKLQVVVIPDSSEVEFHYVDMMECLMGTKWKYRKPIVKVYGEFEVNRKNFRSTTEYVTSIFFKTVPEFSFKKEDGKKLLIFSKNSDPDKVNSLK